MGNCITRLWGEPISPVGEAGQSHQNAFEVVNGSERILKGGFFVGAHRDAPQYPETSYEPKSLFHTIALYLFT